jgi:cytoskeleton protein RodZ
MTQEHKTLKNEDKTFIDVSDNVDAVGPGHILKEAREVLGLSQQDVADKLNFRKKLVENIEAELFDLNLPAAFNRGYLKNYAKLVNISQEGILKSYDKLGMAQRQCAEMQSFSKGTEKQAEHNRLMWITYFILAVLVTATVVWWLQTPSAQPEPMALETAESIDSTSNTNNLTDLSGEIAQNNPDGELNTELKDVNESAMNSLSTAAPDASLVSAITGSVKANEENSGEIGSLDVDRISSTSDTSLNSETSQNQQSLKESELATAEANVVFTFSGDCWVNISDATGERIAWGVKQSGYVMRISGQAPFSITLGRPELVKIDYNDVSIDMTAFNAGNIAKFSLPLTP